MLKIFPENFDKFEPRNMNLKSKTGGLYLLKFSENSKFFQKARKFFLIKKSRIFQIFNKYCSLVFQQENLNFKLKLTKA